MKIKFYAYGHENILATHKTTLEFTKDKFLTKKGDCILGLNSDFQLREIKKFINHLKNKKENNYYHDKIKIILKINIKNMKNKKIITDEINCVLNKNFDSHEEMVIRKSDYTDKRTFAINANKAVCDINADIIDAMKDPSSKLEVLITD